MYVCVCNAVSDREINLAIESGAATLDQLRERLNVATVCGHCTCLIEERLEKKLDAVLGQLTLQSA